MFKKFFYSSHQQRSERFIFWARIICAVVSVTSVLVWSISRSLPALWACLIALAQISQIMIGYLPWEKQLNGLFYLIPALNNLIVDLEDDWLRLGFSEEDDVDAMREKITEYQRRFYEIENQYTTGIWFPYVSSVVEDAEKQWDDYFAVKYGLLKGDADNETTEESGV